MHVPSVGAVEIKVVASETGERQVQRELGLFDRDPGHRDVYFFDTPDLRLFDEGLVLRARLIRDHDDSTVKIRPFPDDADERWSRADGLEVELDVVGTKAVRSAKLDARQNRNEIQEVGAGRRPIRRLFSEAQESLVDDVHRGEVPWDELVPLGPITVHRWEVEPDALATSVTVEEWMLPTTEDIVELSIKVEPDGWQEAQRRFATFLTDHEIELDPNPQAKTRWALESFARRA